MFLPANEKAPEGNYMKLLEGENTFRVLSSAIVGYEYWNTESKPVRSKTAFQSTPADIKVDGGKPTPIKYFWAFVVYNYRAEKRQVLELTQTSIQNAIRSLVENKKWGDPKNYDISITRSGSGLDTEYTVMPNPHAEFPADLVGTAAINLEALFTGEDPFATPAPSFEPADTRTMLQPGQPGYVEAETLPPDFLKP